MSYLVPPETFAAHSRVFEWSASGRRVIVKRRAKPDIIFVHVFQNALAWMLREPILLRTDARGRDKFFEPQKLKALRENGVSVPEVLYECPEYFVLEYVGENLEAILKRERDECRRNEYISRALRRLRFMHEKNFIHGGAQIKNFTCLDGEIYMIDFEEAIPDGFFDEFRQRDLLVFSMSLETAGISRGLDWICRAYDERSGGEICARLASRLLNYRFLKFLNLKIFSWISMNDVRAAISLIEHAERVLRRPVVRGACVQDFGAVAGEPHRLDPEEEDERRNRPGRKRQDVGVAPQYPVERKKGHDEND
jgi:tRNA A-37 threonylcarbamoyl transferase component Bud32